MAEDLPYNCEYAKSGRAACKKCKNPIAQGSLRLAVMTQSFAFDGKVANWHHEDCFFINQRPQTEGDFKNFENLKPTDQKRVREKIASSLLSGHVVTSTAKGKGKKRAKEDTSGGVKDYGIEYAKSARAGCRGCELKIAKDEIRVKKVVFDTEVGMKYGGQALWHHAECFAQVRNDLGWFATGEMLPGFKSLSKDDQKKIKEMIPAVKPEDVPDIKKFKTEVKDEVDSAEDKELIAKVDKQTKNLFKFRDNIEKKMSKPDIDMLLIENNQEQQSDSQKRLDLAADILTFGALLRCSKCTNGQYMFSKAGYQCNGYISDWAKCLNVDKEPKRVICKIPKSLKENYGFLDRYKGSVETRAIRYIPPSQMALTMTGKVKKEETSEPRVKREKPALYGLQFVITGLRDTKDLKSLILKLGGKITPNVHEQLAAVISSPDQVEKMTNHKIVEAKKLGIQVIPVDYVTTVEEAGPGSAISFITSKAICNWGTDPKARIPTDAEEKSKSSKSIYAKSGSKSMKLQVKGGLAVDPESGLADVAHVYVKGKDKYTAVLSLTDISSGKNSFYKLQILQSDKLQKFWVFRAWGRIGTKIGGTKVTDHSTINAAKQEFEELYLDRTGNNFDDRHNFVKVPGRMYPVEVDYGEDEPINTPKHESKVKSKLEKPVESLIKLMFDIETMKRVMKEFDLDTEKMPLGKLSQKQIQSAYKVLTELSELITKGGSNADFIGATNRFYTLIPHSFGMDNPPILDTAEQITNHSEKLDALSEIELAYSMLKNEEVKDDVNSVDQHYEQLKTKLVPIKRDTDEFRLLDKYVQNTHAETHRMYDLEIMDIFKVERSGEARRFKPFKKLHNRKLLWHGSRLTNYVGILSHGLKIAPPEAPVTGYMFGKGIYFADMVSKSANYCFTSKQNSEGILLLSEVALGDMLECTNANYVTKLPKDKHSTKGVGNTQPNPKESTKRDDGVEIPLGKPFTDNKLKTSLLYNEFIVYDVAQVNIQYLFRMNFKYKY